VCRFYLGDLNFRHAKTIPNVYVGSTPGSDQRPPNTKTRDAHQFSTRNNSTTMAPIDDAIAAIESREAGEKFTYQSIADQFGVDRSTLSRRHKGCQAPREAEGLNRRLLSPQQELTLVKYIEDLTKRGLPPTRDMIRNFASDICHNHVGDGWVTRFLHRNHDHLISKWTAGMDRSRHNADSTAKYELYFDLLHGKIEEYGVMPANTYNMDEKGFMIGITGRSKRVFSRRQWEKREVRESLQDGSREWITVVAAVSAAGDRLPPTVIFPGSANSLQSTWVDDVKAGKHDVFLTSTASGWSNNDLGLAWLEQVFNRCTKEKARRGRDWRLLILDGHGSHVTNDFIDYCDDHRILLAIMPPHSTHTLQPLDVVLFKPLSTAYSNQLSSHLQRSQGLVPIRKGDFFPLFWRAWEVSFRKETILKSFEATGIWPVDRERVLERFRHEPPKQAPISDESDWRSMDRLVRAVVDPATTEAKKLRSHLHDISVQNELLHHENDGLREALSSKKKHKKKGYKLDLQQREETHGGATVWSPRKVRESQARRSVNQRLAEEERLQKASDKELKAAATLYKKKIAEEKRVAREEAKVVSDRAKAEKAAEIAAKKATQNTKISQPTAQSGKRKASRASHPKGKRARGGGGSVEPAASSPSPMAAPPKVNSRGRTIIVPSKYR
jgi:hypothetical protein